MNFGFPNCQNTDNKNDHRALFRRLKESKTSRTWYFLGRNSGRIKGQTAARIHKTQHRLAQREVYRSPGVRGGLGDGGCKRRANSLVQGVTRETRPLGSLAAGLGRTREARSLGHPELTKLGGNPAVKAGLGSSKLRAGFQSWLCPLTA